MVDGEHAQSSTVSVDVLHDLHRDVAAVTLPLATPDAAHIGELRERILTQIGSHLLPRLADEAAPAVVVLGGSTGAGKSTLLNSLVGREISTAGVLRPTTRRAVAAHHPSVHAVPLRDLADSVAAPAIPPGMVLVDAPDLDSLERANRNAATRLLEAADLWILVTTAARYGDMVPWQQVIRARDRGLQLAVVLNRVPDDARRDVRADLTERLDQIGLGNSPLFLIPNLGPHEGLIPEEHVQPLREWLRAATGRHQARAIVRRTVAGAWGALESNVSALADGVGSQRAAASGLRAATLDGLGGPQADLVYAIESGQCAAGAPSARWENFARAGMVLAPFSIPGSRASMSPRAKTDRTAALERLAGDVEAAVLTLLIDALVDSSGSIHREWSEADALDLFGDHEPLDAAGARELAAETVAGWRIELVRIADEHAGGAALSNLTTTPGVTALLVAAAGGVQGAEAAAAHFLSAEAVTEARNTLLGAARHAVGATAEPYLNALRSIPDDAAVTRLKEHASKLRSLR
ncbi:MAG TPA: GTPase domain-containing protein [Actinomycetaceae bacterium]|nr:GTPase domain-containing protein [Actinomycetaceae bacterium]